MTDSKHNQHPGRTDGVDVNNRDDVRYWCEKFGCSEVELRAAVARVGAAAIDVEQEVRSASREA